MKCGERKSFLLVDIILFPFQSRVSLLLVSLVVTRGACQEYSSFLAPINEANIDLSQVIFLPSNQRSLQDTIDDDSQTSVREERNIVLEEEDDDEKYEYSDVTTVASDDRDDYISHLASIEGSAEDVTVGDLNEAIYSVDPLEAVFLEEESPEYDSEHPQEDRPSISGSYAYMRNPIIMVVDYFYHSHFISLFTWLGFK